MALVPYLGKSGISPNFIALSSDISSSKISGCNVVGSIVFLSDLGTSKIVVAGDGTLADYALPVAITLDPGSINIGTVDQGTGGSSAWLVDTELPAASALDGAIGKGLSAPTVGAAILVSDGTNLKEVSSTYPVPISGNVGRSATSVTPSPQGSTDSWTVVAGSILDTLNSSSVSYSVKNNEVTNSVDYKILAGNTSNIAEAVEIQASATILAGAYGGYSVSIAPWRYYGTYIQSTLPVTPASVTVRGVTKG